MALGLKSRTMNHVLERRTAREIRESAENLRRLGKMNAPFEVIYSAACNLLSGHVEWVGAYHVHDLYRGRKWQSDPLPTNISELLAPPAGAVSGFGRLNMPGQSLLYASEITQTVLNELRIKNSEQVVVLRLKKRRQLPDFHISRLGMLPTQSEEVESSRRELEISASVGGKANYQKLLSMRRYIEKFFKMVVSSPRDVGFYKVTTALAQGHLRMSDVHGVMYPSVTTRYATCNLAVKPEDAGRLFKPHSVALLKVVRADWDFHHVDTLKTGWVNEDGNLVWDDSIAFESPMIGGMTSIEMPFSS